MKTLTRITLLAIFLLAAVVITISACGGGASSGGSALRALVFNSNPAGFHVTGGFGTTRASSPGTFVVNAQSTTPGGGNFSGFCDGVPLTSGRAATLIYGLGRWLSGDCSTGVADDVGVAIPQAGQIGNLSVDAVGTGTAADDGKVGLTSGSSGQLEVTVLHADGTRDIVSLSCTLGVSNNSKVHCDDKVQAHHVNVVAGDQIIAKFWFNPGDSYRAIRVNIEYATPSF